MLAASASAAGPESTYRIPPPAPEQHAGKETGTVVGMPATHVVREGETLLDIARSHGLGFLELQRLYPEIDPWIPPVGRELTIPRQWIVPPNGAAEIVINLPELRLYHFRSKKDAELVTTYPLGIGTTDNPSPVGRFKVGAKRKNPTWYVPKSLEKKYGTQVVPPGPDNPLGDYWISLGQSGYGLHGTNIAWSVGRLATHGCIRLYPEHIQPLFARVRPEQDVTIIYEPIKLGVVHGRVYAQAYPDIYGRIDDYVHYAYLKLSSFGAYTLVDVEKYSRVIAQKNGRAVDISSE
ncbi:L,D-transpeptidase family protein [Desulfovermiculus halophilus]|uniref:L,D-transpeptidase family protein n=1 Tax=Desulfovermiculus halophilus TaxID=339722 RepID=UPI0013774DEB|nr:L,D-transpeptidase family protein [Desulfovermiculus halophilus]